MAWSTTKEKSCPGNQDNIRNYFEREASDFDGAYGNGQMKDWVRRASYFYNRKPIQARLEAVKSLIPHPQGKTILEVGCGPGIYSIALAKAGARVTGVDYSGPMIESAGRNAQRAGVKIAFKQMNFVEDPLEGVFDAAFAAGVIEYIDPLHQVAFMKKMKGLSSQNVIVSFPKGHTLHRFVREVWLKYFKKIEICFFNNESIAALASQAGLKEVERRDAGVLWVVKFQTI